MPAGGYRAPGSPAPVSGPGAYSRRTDGQPTSSLPNAKYGEGAAFEAQQQAAPMSASGPDLSGLVPMNAPSNRPDEPITAGMPGGPGPGPSVPANTPQIDPDRAARLRSYLPALVLLASQDDVDPQTKAFVRSMRAELG